jgi:hypothetical protein
MGNNERREELAAQVREEYSNIMASDSQQHFHLTATNMTPEAYYGHLQNLVIAEIHNGRFDTCRSGSEIINKVAADKSVLPNWKA